MSGTTREPVALACVPGAIPAGERATHFALLARLFRELARESQRVAEGYAIRFDADTLPLVARFIENERKCCPFLTFAVELAPAGGPLWLRMTGPAGTAEFLEAELPLGRSAA